MTTETETQLRWLSPAEAPFDLDGFPWFGQDRVYRRMPVQTDEPLPEAVNSLANNTAGGQIRFRSDTGKLAIRVTLDGMACMYHMPATGQCCFDCYLGAPGKQRYLGTSRYEHTKTKEYEHTFFDQARTMREITLNFPLYQGVESVEVGVDPDADLAPPTAYPDPRPIVCYGTSITHGGCACRPGMAYTNILSRWMRREFINLGFSGSGRGEPIVAQCMAAIPNPAVLVLDYEANAGLTGLQATLPTFIEILRAAHPTVPILVVSRIGFAGDAHWEANFNNRLAAHDFQRDTVAALRGKGDTRISFLDGATLLGDNYDECTVDGVHPTDLGFMRMAEGLRPVLEGILRG